MRSFRKQDLIFIPAILQLMVFWTFDLGVDEAHYMLYARHLAWSYFDHPPLVGWVHFLLNQLLGENLLAARLPAIAIGAFSSWQIFQFLKRQNFSENEAILATLASGFAFQIFVLDTFLLPDTLCVLLIWPLLHSTVRITQQNKFRDWLCLGLCLGLSGLAKYTSVLLLVPVAVTVIAKLRFSFLKKPGFYAAVLIAGLLVLPVFVWNQQHDWQSFRYQTHHVLSSQGAVWQSFWQSWGMQFVIYSPFLWGFAIWGFFQLYKKMKSDHSAELQFVWWTTAVILLFFWSASFQNTVLPHWPVLFYLFALPFGVAAGFRLWPKFVLACMAATTSLVLLLVILLITGIGFHIPQALKDVGGWPQVMSSAKEKLAASGKSLQSLPKNVAVTNWTYASRALYYGKSFESQIFVLGEHADQFDLWKTRNPEGTDILILQMVGDEKDLSSWLSCETLEPADLIPVTVRGSHLYDVSFQWCRKAHLKSVYQRL